MLQETPENILEYVGLIGKKVRKAKKPFLSGLQINTVKGIVIEQHINRYGFIFEEDESVVECWRCVGVDDE
jgi:hypothetical protein